MPNIIWGLVLLVESGKLSFTWKYGIFIQKYSDVRFVLILKASYVIKKKGEAKIQLTIIPWA